MVCHYLFDVVFVIGCAAGCLCAPDSGDVTELAVNIGENVTLACAHSGDKVMWVKEDRSERMRQSHIQHDGSLNLPSVARDDTGIYTCALEDRGETAADGETISGRELDTDEALIRSKYRLIVRTPPAALINVTVHPSTVLALLLWEVGDSGGSDITHFTARYRQIHAEEWLDVIPRHISPNARQIDIYHLNPNSSYTFQVWALNDVGPGDKVTVEATTKHVIEEIELARHLLQGVETFDTRVWVAAVAVVMGTLLVLSLGTCYLMFKDHNISLWSTDEQEVLELVPNIILNPGFLDEPDRPRPMDENSNDQPHVAFNNNTIVRPHPIRV